MSEQAPQSEDTPTVDTPQGTGTEDQHAQQNWEERYKEAQAWGTRVAQEKAQFEQQAQMVAALQSDDPDARRQAIEALGLEVVDDTPNDDTYVDPQDQLASRLEALEAQIQQRDQQAQQQQQIAQIEQHVEKELASLAGLDESDREWVVNTAVAMPPTAEGMPDIQAAFEKFTAWTEAQKNKWASTKRTTHRVSPVGEAGTQQPDLTTHDGRVAHVLGRMEAEEQ